MDWIVLCRPPSLCWSADPGEVQTTSNPPRKRLRRVDVGSGSLGMCSHGVVALDRQLALSRLNWKSIVCSCLLMHWMPELVRRLIKIARLGTQGPGVLGVSGARRRWSGAEPGPATRLLPLLEGVRTRLECHHPLPDEPLRCALVLVLIFPTRKATADERVGDGQPGRAGLVLSWAG